MPTPPALQTPIFDRVGTVIAAHHVGDFASLIGIPLTLWGLLLTYRAAKTAKEEATDAKKSVKELRETLLLVDTVADLTNATAMMEEIKRLHRAAFWAALPDRYAELRKRLIAINTANRHLSDAQRSVLQGAVLQLVAMEQGVEQALALGRIPKSSARYNKVITEQMDKVVVVLTAIRQNIGA